ncbi:MAG TPA: LysR family transcriptional regulator, partial [Streptosporangiaceae bacterium]|nr:LysR family transcriptional regulator [Streptosporangiaceae bacterium]
MAGLETREMECFVAVAETLHFGIAAERLGIGQPALSRVVARLERRLDVILFDRTTRRVTLTPAGESFLAECRRILTDIEGAIRRVQRSARPAGVTLAVRPGTGQGVLADILAAYRDEPGSSPVEVVFTHFQESSLRDGTADIALTCQTAPLPDDLGRMEVGAESPVALVPGNHPLAARSSVMTADLLAFDDFAATVPLDTMESIVDRVALGHLLVITGASVRRRLTSSVTAVPVLDSPWAHLHLAWLPGASNPARDLFLGTAERILPAAPTAVPGARAAGARAVAAGTAGAGAPGAGAARPGPAA